MDELVNAILEGCTPVERPPLEEAPLPEFDLGAAQVCPHCGGLDAQVSESEDGEVCNCPDCQALFTPKVEGLSRRVIRKLAERRARRFQELARYEAMFSQVPPPGVDPDDYAAFRVAAETPEAAEENLPVADVPL